METFKLTVNGQQKDVTVDPSTPLLWVLREDLKMTGTKWLRHCRMRGLYSACRRYSDTVLRRSHFSRR